MRMIESKGTVLFIAKIEPGVRQTWNPGFDLHVDPEGIVLEERMRQNIHSIPLISHGSSS